MKIELHKQQYTVTLFDYNFHLAQFFGRCKNLCVTVQFLLCFILNLRAISKYKPLGAYIWRGYLMEGFLCYEFGGAYFRNSVVVLQPYSFLLLYSSW